MLGSTSVVSPELQAEIKAMGDQIAELSAALRDALQIADRRYASPLPDADWALSAADIVQAQLSVSLSRHVPGWPGATDEQLAAVAREIIDALDNT